MSKEERLKHHRYFAENIVKRTKKADLVGVIAYKDLQHEEELEKVRADAATARDERDGLRRELVALRVVRDLVQVLVQRFSGRSLKTGQLSLIFQKDREDLGDNAIEDALVRLMDNAEKFLEEFGGGWGAPSYDDLENALGTALGDRESLLRRLKLTDAEWSAQGGASFADVEPV